jgi:hypothetical protein
MNIFCPQEQSEVALLEVPQKCNPHTAHSDAQQIINTKTYMGDATAETIQHA